MHPLRLLSAAEQVALHLSGELERGRWSGTLPGAHFFAAELGVNRKTIEASLRLLEQEGRLVGQGAGRKRMIQPSGNTVRARGLKVGILPAEQADLHLSYLVELQHALVEAGHRIAFSGKSLLELGMNVDNIRRSIGRIEADAWILLAASREVLEWFSNQKVPAFALFGFQQGLPIAGIKLDKPNAYVAAVRNLIELGHKRIVIISRRMGGSPEPRVSEEAALSELRRHGIKTGDYNLPIWEETPEGLQKLLGSLFRLTPPTAMIIDEAPLFAATQQFLANQGLRVPQQVSLICTDPDPTFSWCIQSVAHIYWDSGPFVRRVVRWAANVSRGKIDTRQSMVAAKFMPGGTIGRAIAD